MIRTTGTTGTPKAARHDWRVLTRTVESVEPAPDQRWLLAYGAQQFAGVQVLLHTLASQTTLVAPFPRLPKDSVQAMLDEKVTCVSATPTFWRFLLAEARSRRVELPELQQITLGGEAVPQDLLDELRNLFPEANVSQVYASTELGSITSVRDGRPGLPAASLHGPGSNVRVEDGELWVRARRGMLGYAARRSPADPASGARPATWSRSSATASCSVAATPRSSTSAASRSIRCRSRSGSWPCPTSWRRRVFGRAEQAHAAPSSPSTSCRPEARRRRPRQGPLKQSRRRWPTCRACQPRSVNLVDAIETRGGRPSGEQTE